MFYYDFPNSTKAKMVSNLKATNINKLSTQDKLIYNWYKFVSDNDLMGTPFVRLRKDDGEIIMIFLDPTDYDKIKKYSYSKLVEYNHKIRIKAEIVDLKHESMKVYKVTTAISFNKVSGKTYWKK